MIPPAGWAQREMGLTTSISRSCRGEGQQEGSPGWDGCTKAVPKAPAGPAGDGRVHGGTRRGLPRVPPCAGTGVEGLTCRGRVGEGRGEMMALKYI